MPADSPVRLTALRAVSLALGYAALYACADTALNRLGFSDSWTILWPLNGITIALLLMRPRAEWGAMLFGIALGTGFGEWRDGNSIGSEIWLRAFSVLEMLLSAWLLPAFTSLDDWLRKPRISLYFARALAVGPGLSGVLAASFFHIAQHQRWLLAFNDWATSDALGIAAVMPLALCAGSPEMRAMFRNRGLVRTLLVLAPAFGVLILSFWVSRFPLLFLVYPTLLSVDLLLSFSGSAIAGAGLCFVSIYMATHHHGVFALWPADLFVSRDVGLQAFLAFHLLALFPASILIRERRTLIEDLNSSNAQLLMLASLDGLTGISNRRSLDEQFSKEWKRGVRLQTPLALMMIDVDLFKQFNDRYGHHAGDECLRAIAQTLNENVRRVQDIVARFGGEEFAILLPHTDLLGAAFLAEKLRGAIHDLGIRHEDSPWGVITVSVGCSAMVPTLHRADSELIKLADAALYRAKHGGRNRVQSGTAVAGPVVSSLG